MPALKKLGILFRNPSLVIPQIHVKRLEELDFVQLKAKGIKYLVFDKDNTLTLAFVDDLHDSVRDAMDRAHTHFPGNIAILSNSVGSSDDKGYRAAAETEKRLKIPVIRHRIKKPACMSEVKDHFAKKRTVKEFRVMDLSDPLTATAVSSKGSESEDGGDEGGKVVLPSEICMVGDRVLTDVVFGNINGMMSVLVAPLCLKTDHPISVLIRMLETKVLLPLLVRVLGVRARSLQTRSSSSSSSSK
jgi:phosphatidylglycerophosphatase GEP4